jgi:hypothetical protein
VRGHATGHDASAWPINSSSLRSDRGLESEAAARATDAEGQGWYGWWWATD